MRTYIVNITKSAYDRKIMRPGPLGNPFYLVNPDDNLERRHVLWLFDQWFYKEIAKNPVYVEEVHNCYGLILGCVCKPKLCHGDIIVDYLNHLPADVREELEWRIQISRSSRR
jgi:hypothetical protein